MQKVNEKKKIPMKNYIILGVLFLVTFLLAYYIYQWYVVYSDYQNEIPVIREHLPEITEEEMEHYIQENSTTVIYICTASDIECRTFEKNFTKLIEKDSLQDYITYVNLTEENKESFITNFNNNHPYKKIGLTKYPALIFFEDGEVSDILQATQDHNLTITEVDKFLKNNKIGINY